MSSSHTKEDHSEGERSVKSFPSRTSKERTSHKELRQFISSYVEDILHRSSQVLGIKIKLPERKLPAEKPVVVRETKTSEYYKTKVIYSFVVDQIQLTDVY